MEEHAAEGDWQNLGAGGTWYGMKRRVKGVKLGLSRSTCYLVPLLHSASPSHSTHLFPYFTLQCY